MVDVFATAIAIAAVSTASPFIFAFFCPDFLVGPATTTFRSVDHQDGSPCAVHQQQGVPRWNEVY